MNLSLFYDIVYKLCDGDHLANTNGEGHVAANNGEDEQVEVVNANGGSKDAALKNNPYIRDPLSNIVGPMTRARRKRMNESLNSLIVTTWAKEEIKLEDYKPKTINLLQVTPMDMAHLERRISALNPQRDRRPHLLMLVELLPKV
ncbi:OLC1v1036203C1 [Oldenlandia corymbosa var. corymbosa]|uniref:OLC1v1036203C1 n=1 Tax=Oldenlandia corymbosa var. corymbosa TaxID=529605 RepID=A0AAV1CUS8_OLDCO|nr:OLC1v1036203C1 [Oldenlandia corymbosa var. corymbosa]